MKLTDAVLLLAYGGPASIDDVPAFLQNVRGGAPVLPAMLAEMTRRYQLIGGRSPLLDITRRLAVKLQNAIDVPVFVGMRHWHPFIAATVREMIAAGIARATAICLAPHYSDLSIGAYRQALNEALRGSSLEIDFIEAWHTQPRYIEGIAQNVRAALKSIDADAHIVFTAHSLPLSAREPYASQVCETAQLVAQSLNLRDGQWSVAYQSRPRAPGDWLAPPIETLVPQLARAGKTNIVVAPIGFLAEHIEILYDLDIALQDIARANKAHLARAPMLNDGDALVQALAELVQLHGVKKLEWL